MSAIFFDHSPFAAFVKGNGSLSSRDFIQFESFILIHFEGFSALKDFHRFTIQRRPPRRPPYRRPAGLWPS